MESIRFAENLSVFVDVVQARSFSAVARQRGIATSSVARQIDALENMLQVALFTRSTRAMVPTDVGTVLFERAVKILRDIGEAHDEVLAIESEVRGLLRVSCLPAFARRHILPSLGELLSRHPGLRVEIDLTERQVDPVIERMDLVIRVGAQPDSALIAQCVGTHRYLPCAAPSYLAQHGRPNSRAMLAGHRLIDRRHSTSIRGWRELLSPSEMAASHVALECDDCDSRRLAVLQGLGIALMPDWSVGEDIAAARLQVLNFSDLDMQSPSGIYVLRALPRLNARSRAFVDHLIRKIGQPNIWDIASQTHSDLTASLQHKGSSSTADADADPATVPVT